ncbi:unnamed protein product [Toxocara canis]|uniref:Uncharacterized protein n=1 Tax=Toxocara canis TaxID=6265 RepID=A0A183VFQ7_TOXCA|nr:unnamed protein product [Toxocara canis]
MGPDTKFVSSSSGILWVVGMEKLGTCELPWSSMCDSFQDKSKMGQLPRKMDLALKYGIRACDLQVPESCANVGR